MVTTSDIMDQVLTLPPKQRGEIAKLILATLHPDSPQPPTTAEEFSTELEARSARIASGASTTAPAPVVIARARQAISEL